MARRINFLYRTITDQGRLSVDEFSGYLVSESTSSFIVSEHPSQMLNPVRFEKCAVALDEGK